MSSHKRGIKAVIRRARRGLRRKTSHWLARRSGTPDPVRAPLTTPDSILVCRLNRRIGNCLFTTPMLMTLADTWPDTAIDIVMLDQANAKLLETLPNVRRVYALPNRPLSDFRLLVATVRSIRSQHYDLAIDPTRHSSSNRFALRLCKARHRLGFADRHQWVNLTHAAAVADDIPHQALQSVHLLCDAITNTRFVRHNVLAVFPDDRARQQAARLLQSAIGEPARTDSQAKPVVGFFAQATGKKQLPPDWWHAWHGALQQCGHDMLFVQIVAPGHPPIAEQIPSISCADLPTLAAAIGKMDLFVAADSGPMHLAAASGTPVIGLFKATDPRVYAPLSCHSHTLSGNELVPEVVATHVQHQLQWLRQNSPPQSAADSH